MPAAEESYGGFHRASRSVTLFSADFNLARELNKLGFSCSTV